MRANPGPPNADRDMTFEEKRKLSVFVGALDGDKLDRVIEIITQEQPELPGKGLLHFEIWQACHVVLTTCCADAGWWGEAGGGRGGAGGRGPPCKIIAPV